MTEPQVVGPVPWLPGRVGRAITAPIPAERLAAMRIATGAVLLADLLVQYLPHARILYGPGGYTAAVYPPGTRLPGLQWSLLGRLPADWGGYALLAAGVAAATALLVGWRPRAAAAVAWVVVVSLFHVNWMIHNGGDRIRPLLLMLLTLTPCAAAWAVRPAPTGPRPLLVSGWPAAVVLVQLAALYAASGWTKFLNPVWRDGTAMTLLTKDVAWCSAPPLLAAVPEPLLRLVTWGTVGWELLFPVVAVVRPWRTTMLVLGVVFHLSSAILFDIGMFAFYTLCCYPILLPVERWFGPTAAVAAVHPAGYESR